MQFGYLTKPITQAPWDRLYVLKKKDTYIYNVALFYKWIASLIYRKKMMHEDKIQKDRND